MPVFVPYSGSTGCHLYMFLCVVVSECVLWLDIYILWLWLNGDILSTYRRGGKEADGISIISGSKLNL